MEFQIIYPYVVSFFFFWGGGGCLNPIKPPRIVKRRVNSDKAIHGMLNKMNVCGISSNMNSDLSSDPNINYGILHNHISKMKNICLSNLRNFTNTRTTNGYPSERFNPLKSGMQYTWSLNDAINTMSNTTHRKITFRFSLVFWRKPFVKRKYKTMINHSPNTKAISRRHGKPYQILFVNPTWKEKH